MKEEEYAIVQDGQKPADHEHVRHVAIADGIAIRYCAMCDRSHILDKSTNTWILIKEQKDKTK